MCVNKLTYIHLQYGYKLWYAIQHLCFICFQFYKMPFYKPQNRLPISLTCWLNLLMKCFNHFKGLCSLSLFCHASPIGWYCHIRYTRMPHLSRVIFVYLISTIRDLYKFTRIITCHSWRLSFMYERLGINLVLSFGDRHDFCWNVYISECGMEDCGIKCNWDGDTTVLH